MKKTSNHDPAFGRPTNILKVLEERTSSIRKFLMKHEKNVQPESRGAFDDAVKLSKTIEQLCSHGKNLPAADANIALDLVEQLFEQLESNCIEFLHQKSARNG